MVMCWVKNCRHYGERDNCRFFRFPKDEITRKKWIELIRRPDKGPSTHSMVCSCHFLNEQKENGPTIFQQEQFHKLDRRKRRKPESRRKPTSKKSKLGFTARVLEEHNYSAHSLKEEIVNNNIEVAQYVEIEASKDLMEHILCDKDSVDITLAIEGRHLTAHKVLLSMFSTYFRDLFKTSSCKHPIVFMKDISYSVMKDLLDFMYRGKVHVRRENLNTFLNTAESLKIKGLSNSINTLKQSSSKEHHEIVTAEPLTFTNEEILPFKVEPYHQELLLDDPLAETNINEIEKIELFKTDENFCDDTNAVDPLGEYYDCGNYNRLS